MNHPVLLDPASLRQVLDARAAAPGPFAALPPPAERGLRVVPSPSAGAGPAAQDGDQELPAPPVGAEDRPPEIWLYGDIGGWGIYVQDVRWALDQLGDAPRVKVRIHSRGGSVFEGAAIYTVLQQSGKEVHVQVDGVAFSDACNIAMVGKTVTISPRGFMMIHEAWDCSCGPAAEHDRAAALLRKINPSIAALYEPRLGKSRAEILSLMEGEAWWNAEEAVAAGLADAILSADQAPDPAALPSIEDTGGATNRAPREALERFCRATQAPPSPRQTLAAEVAAYLKSSATNRRPPDGGRITTDTLRAVEAALGRL